MRAESAVSTEAVDSLRAAQERGRAKADATLARSDNEKARSGPGAAPIADQ